jgi:glycosyltransferase involved in cell wall biosynthesis
MNKISLKKDAGPIVFVGGMNAMPMMYAIEFRKLGYEVLYIVDRPISDKLSRPENHFSEIVYPYPSWIVESIITSQIVLPYFRSFFSKRISELVRRRFERTAQAYILNGFYSSLAPFLDESAAKIGLSHGSDLDSWADVDGCAGLAESFKRKSVFKFLPTFIAKPLIKLAVSRQLAGFIACDTVVYFPRGFNSFGDRVLDKLESAGVRTLERYDISFEPLKYESRDFKSEVGPLVIFSGVRFTFKTFSEGNSDYAKGNDHIINGLGEFYRNYKDIEIHFVEKGPDVNEAKRLVSENGLQGVVKWHKEMKFTELLSLYRRADICFDQVGRHWIGAIGAYALWLGKPLIANDALPVRIGFWPIENPVCSAASANDVCEQLLLLSSKDKRKEISNASRAFAEEYFSPKKVVVDLIS